MKKIMPLLCALCLLLGCACTGKKVETEENGDNATESSGAEQTVAENETEISETKQGLVMSVEDNTVTVMLVSSDIMDLSNPMGVTDGDTSSGDNGSVPQMPSEGQGAGNGETPPEKPDGEQSNGQNPDSEKQDGEQSDADKSGEDKPDDKPDAKPDGDEENTAEGNNAQPAEATAGGDNGGMTMDFSGSEMPSEIISFDLNEVKVYSSDGTAEATPEVGDVILINYDAEGNILSAQISAMEAGNDSTQPGTGMQGGPGEMSGGMSGGMPGGGSDKPEEYEAVISCDEDTQISGKTIESTGDDENAILIEDGNVEISGVEVIRDSDTSTGGDNSSFYGVGAAILATGGTVKISDSEITTDSAGGAGVFSYGDAQVYVSDTVINTSGNCAGGIHAAGGGTLYADNVTAVTQGESSAAIRSDRGGGTMVVTGGSYTSNGVGSPAIYCTAEITVSGAQLEATGSEAVCIEGLNSLYLTDCDLSGNMADSRQNDCTWNVILYQSMSGDSQVGNSTFQMTGGTLTAGNGGMFYTTNTESTFILENVTLVYSDDNPFLLRCTGNANERGWGTTGQNGADCTFTAINQELQGKVIWDSISELDFSLTEGSILTGSFVNDESCAGAGGDGKAVLRIDAGSKWIVTGDSVITELYNAGTITDAAGRTVTIKGTDGTIYVSGTSEYTITVSSYSAQ